MAKDRFIPGIEQAHARLPFGDHVPGHERTPGNPFVLVESIFKRPELSQLKTTTQVGVRRVFPESVSSPTVVRFAIEKPWQSDPESIIQFGHDMPVGFYNWGGVRIDQYGNVFGQDLKLMYSALAVETTSQSATASFEAKLALKRIQRPVLAAQDSLLDGRLDALKPAQLIVLPSQDTEQFMDILGTILGPQWEEGRHHTESSSYLHQTVRDRLDSGTEEHVSWGENGKSYMLAADYDRSKNMTKAALFEGDVVDGQSHWIVWMYHANGANPEHFDYTGPEIPFGIGLNPPKATEEQAQEGVKRLQKLAGV